MLVGPSLHSHARRDERVPSLLHAETATPAPHNRLDRVRGAGRAFLRGTTVGWSRRELADWLVCQYAPCAATPPDAERKELPPACERTLDEGILERVILDARGRVLTLLADLVVHSQGSPIARLAVACGTVVAQHDERGGIAYSPVRLRRMRLSERVASLFIADYLNHPNDYRSVKVCPECGDVSFAADAEHASWCEAPLGASGSRAFSSKA
jgi:ribosomal protein S27AE